MPHWKTADLSDRMGHLPCSILLLLIPCLLVASQASENVQEVAQEVVPKTNIEPATQLAVKETAAAAGDETEEVPESAADKNDKLMKGAVALGSVIAAIAGVASGPVGAAIAVGVVVVAYFVDLFKESNTDLWKKLEDKVEIKIGEKLAKYHLDTLYTTVFRVLERRIRNPENFDSDDLEIILDKGLMVFPQNYQSIGWSYDLPLAILNWIPFMIAGYQQEIKKDAQPVCALANELARTRAKVITGMKEMFRKRYAIIHGSSYTYDRTNYPCKKKKKNRKNKQKRKASIEKRYGRLGMGGGRKTECVSIDRLMTYDDGLSGGHFTIRKRNTGWVGGKSWSNEINKIKTATADFLWTEVVEKINKFFDPVICLESLGCTCPEKITKAEITFSYPSTCFGDRRCMHPCGRFGYDYDWCYINRNPDQDISGCRVNWDTCWHISTPEITLPNVLPARTSESGGSGTGPGTGKKEENENEDESENESEE